MSSSSCPRATRSLVSHVYEIDGYLPRIGEIIVVRLSQDLTGPCSDLSTLRSLPSNATRRNYHSAVVSSVRTRCDEIIEFGVFPVSSYSDVDESGLTSTSWVLSQTEDIQLVHIPLPHEPEPEPSSQEQPRFPTPAAFGEPLYVGGWKARRPSWVLAIPQVARMKCTTKVRILPYFR
jgi:hypothetical protein